MQKTKIQILEETANFYGSNPSLRATSPHGCRFRTKKNGGNFCYCAVGRLIDPQHPDAKNAWAFFGNTTDLFEEYSENILKEEYRGHELSFWQEVQWFHDDNDNWTNTGLSKRGENNLNELKEQYSTERETTIGKYNTPTRSTDELLEMAFSKLYWNGTPNLPTEEERLNQADAAKSLILAAIGKLDKELANKLVPGYSENYKVK